MFEFKATLPLRYAGDCSLLGIAQDFTLYVEETYSPNAWLAHHALKLDGTIIASADEDNGQNLDAGPLELPAGLVKPAKVWNTMSLNYGGARHRGIRALDRIDETVRPLQISEKIALVERFKLDILPPMLLGVAESYVLAEAELVRPTLFLVCRRLRLAYLLPEERRDDSDTPYDYDTLVLYIAHTFDCELGYAPPLDEVFEGLGGVQLRRPMDCMIYENYVFIAEGGSESSPSAIYVWDIRPPRRETKRGLYD